LAAGDNNNQINVIQIKPALASMYTLQGHQDCVNHCVFASDELKRLVSISQDHTMRIWDLTRR